MAIVNINTHIPTEGKHYFLDCNILMYMFYPNGSYASDLISDYSCLISNIIGSNADIFITDMLISEFVNTYVQAEFHRLASINGWPHTKTYFKSTFKLTTDYSDILKEIKCILERQLFPISKRIDIKFSNITLTNIFDNPPTFDFNDRYYGLSLENESAYIVTNDADFSNVCGCDIITRNQTLLGTVV